jgi:hypothetical protein
MRIREAVEREKDVKKDKCKWLLGSMYLSAEARHTLRESA